VRAQLVRFDLYRVSSSRDERPVPLRFGKNAAVQTNGAERDTGGVSDVVYTPRTVTGTRERVDVGVVTWNTAELTITALRRLLDTEQGCEIRLFVRDNASSDGTAAAIASSVPEAVLEAGEQNLGFAAGMNRLIARSDAPWFFMLNPDAWPEEGAIGRLVTAVRSSERTAAAAPKLVRPDGTLEHSTHPFPSLRVASAVAFGGPRLRPATGDELMLAGYWAHDRPRDVDWAVGAALLVRRDALDEVGPLDERFFMYVEDLEWCWRASRKGWGIRFEPAAVVVHVGNASGVQRYGDRRTEAYMRNTYAFYRREHGALATGAYRALNLAGSAIGYTRARVRRDTGTAAYWKRELAAHLPRRRA
jgi:N-acetylglucosaminyl-diphospho-decaprenol L-rhamnosyltransferase